MPAMGLRTSEYATCASAELNCALGGIHLGLRAFDLLLFADGLKGAEMLLGGLILRLRLGDGDLLIVDSLRASAPSAKRLRRLSRTFCAASSCSLAALTSVWALTT